MPAIFKVERRLTVATSGASVSVVVMIVRLSNG
jgi:hypothetical protein